MSRKRVKQYLMLLMAIGVIAIAAGGGSGTFASFSAEVTNSSNTFATGTLVLNDNGGTTTCTSAVDNTNQNSSGTNCDTLFTVSKFAFATAAIGASTTISSSSGSSASMPITGLSGTIYKGDVLTLDNGTTTDTVTVVSPSYTNSSGTLTVDASGLTSGHSYTTGDTVTDNNPTSLAKLTLTDQGTLNASGISFKSSAACTDNYGGGNTTLNMGTVTKGASSGTTLTVASSTGFTAGDPLVVSDGTNYQTFKVSSVPSSTTIDVTAAQNWNAAYTTSATVTGVRFNGGTAPSLCSSLKLSITETDSSQSTDFSTAQTCAYGGTTSPVATNACDLSGGTALSSLPTTLTSLSLTSGYGGNTGTELDAGQSRYFLLAIHYTGTTFGNTYQNWKSSSFDLTWHISQA